MKRFITFEERGGTNDCPSPAKLATDAATLWVNTHNAEVLLMAIGIAIDHERGTEDYTLTLHVQLPEAI